jgi:hypothetical protein
VQQRWELLCFTLVKRERYAIGIPVRSPIQKEEEEELLCFTVVKRERYAIGIPIRSLIQMEDEGGAPLLHGG